MNAKKSALAIVVAVVLLSSLVVGTASAGGEHWYLTSSTTGPGDYQMQKSGSGATETEFVTLQSTNVKVWAADSAALGAIDMDGLWNTSLVINVAHDNPIKVKMELGKLSGVAFTSVGDVEETIAKEHGYHNWWPDGPNPGSFSMSSSEYLAIRISNTGTTTFSVTIYPDSGDTSKIRSPASSPVYPVPELSTIMLTCIGMLMLGGFVVYSRRRNNK